MEKLYINTYDLSSKIKSKSDLYIAFKFQRKSSILIFDLWNLSTTCIKRKLFDLPFLINFCSKI